MKSESMTQAKSEGSEEGYHFAFLVLGHIGVDLKVAELTSLLTEIVNGERTLLSSPAEVKAKDKGGNLDANEAAELRKIATEERKRFEEMQREQAEIMLKVIRKLQQG